MGNRRKDDNTISPKGGNIQTEHTKDKKVFLQRREIKPSQSKLCEKFKKKLKQFKRRTEPDGNMTTKCYR